MKRLVLDTCFAACSAAVITPERTAAAYEPMARGHAEALMPMIAKVMADSDMDFAALDEIVVTTGPGTFTGMRVGIAAARALALASGAPLSGLSSLQLMAYSARRQLEASSTNQSADEDEGSPLVVAVDARKKQIYIQSFDARLIALAPPQVILPRDTLHCLPKGRVIAVGTGAAALLAAFEQASADSPDSCSDRHAEDGAANTQANADAASCGNRDSGIDLQVALPNLQPTAGDIGQHRADTAPGRQTIRPLYLRPADAKPQTGKRIARAR